MAGGLGVAGGGCDIVHWCAPVTERIHVSHSIGLLVSWKKSMKWLKAYFEVTVLLVDIDLSMAC